MTDLPDHLPDASEQAVAWFARLQSDSTTDADWTAFAAWLAESPEHQSAYEAVERLWVELDLDAGLAAALEGGPAVVLPFVSRPKPKRWPVWAATGGIAACLLVGVIVPRWLQPPQAEPLQIMTTAKGERRVLQLGVGVRVDLSSDSQLAYRVDKRNRLVRLIRGEAAFTVVHDPARLFEVEAGDRRISDVGTVFDVARIDHAVRVTVQQGVVAVDAAAARLGVRVTAGWQLTHREGEAGSTLKAVDAQAEMAWRSGRLIYRDATLGTVVSDLNRYFATPIHIDDPRAAELRFTGVLVLDSEGAVVARLQAFEPVAVARANGAIGISGLR
jgi:transmembrane sensor